MLGRKAPPCSSLDVASFLQALADCWARRAACCACAASGQQRRANLAMTRNYMLYCRVAMPLVTDGGLNVLGKRLQVLRPTKGSAGDSDQTRAPCGRHRSAPERSQ